MLFLCSHYYLSQAGNKGKINSGGGCGDGGGGGGVYKVSVECGAVAAVVVAVDVILIGIIGTVILA